MQRRSQQLSRLRQELIRLRDLPIDDLAIFLSDRPLIKGTLYPLRRRCGKPSCRCIRGALHETMVLTANLQGKTRLWSIPKDRIQEIRQRTEYYRSFRKARAAFIRKVAQRQREMLRWIDAIRAIRTEQP